MAEIDDFGAGERATTDVDEEWREQTPGGWRARLLEQTTRANGTEGRRLADRRAGDGAPICTSCSKPDPCTTQPKATGHVVAVRILLETQRCTSSLTNRWRSTELAENTRINWWLKSKRPSKTRSYPRKSNKKDKHARKREEETEEQELRQMGKGRERKGKGQWSQTDGQR